MYIGLRGLFGHKNFDLTTVLLLAAGSIPAWLFIAAMQLQHNLL